MNPQVDDYLERGCGRCSLFDTPECKVHRWVEILRGLRRILLDCPVVEERKWGVPCYTVGGKNVVLLSALKDSCTLGFLKGVLLKDPQGVLQKPGLHSQSDRVWRFTDLTQVQRHAEVIKTYVAEAVAVERAGLKVESADIGVEDLPEELQSTFAADPVFAEAFWSLTPGRRKGYIIHIVGAKQSKTRIARIEKHRPRILEGFGMHD